MHRLSRVDYITIGAERVNVIIQVEVVCPTLEQEATPKGNKKKIKPERLGTFESSDFWVGH
jgi:hypothetical protein